MAIDTIYVYLLDEGVDVWRPVAAEHLDSDVYRIVDATPPEELWQFNQGDIVRCRLRRLSGDFGRVAEQLVAFEKV